MQSNLQDRLHVAIIMDGNGRWATERGLPRSVGHQVGARVVRSVVRAAQDLGIGTLSLYAFACKNWRRPEPEVAGLIGLLERFLKRETGRLAEQDVRLSLIGRRDRLSPGLIDEVNRAEAITRGGSRLHLRIAFDYSARDSILHAARQLISQPRASEETFSDLVTGTGPCADVDFLIRTGGEQRLSDFLLWECAHAELYFTACQWPDFGICELAGALDEFRSRERRFGGLSINTAQTKPGLHCHETDITAAETHQLPASAV